MNHDLEPASRIAVDRTAAQVSPSDYDALILPGGTVNADRLRMDPDVRSVVQEVVTDEGPDRSTLVSSRNPGDLEAFCAKIVDVFAASADRGSDRRTTA